MFGGVFFLINVHLPTYLHTKIKITFTVSTSEVEINFGHRQHYLNENSLTIERSKERFAYVI